VKTTFFAAIPEVVGVIESYDITTVRASVGNYLIGKYIRQNTDVKVIFNGDGSDEASGSYLYFYNAPSDEAFEFEVNRLLEEISVFDVLRSDRTISTHGLEPRTPFLDRQFVNVYVSVATELRRPLREKRRAEKQLLRESFDPSFEGGWSEVDERQPLLPSPVLWRTKEAFSDGVSSTERSWYEAIADRLQLEAAVHDQEESATKFETSHNPPFTAESRWYRRLFTKTYGSLKNADRVIPHFWMPRWCGDARDPSARALDVYQIDLSSGLLVEM